MKLVLSIFIFIILWQDYQSSSSPTNTTNIFTVLSKTTLTDLENILSPPEIPNYVVYSGNNTIPTTYYEIFAYRNIVESRMECIEQNDNLMINFYTIPKHIRLEGKFHTELNTTGNFTIIHSSRRSQIKIKNAQRDYATILRNLQLLINRMESEIYNYNIDKYIDAFPFLKASSQGILAHTCNSVELYAAEESSSSINLIGSITMNGIDTFHYLNIVTNKTYDRSQQQIYTNEIKLTFHIHGEFTYYKMKNTRTGTKPLATKRYTYSVQELNVTLTSQQIHPKSSLSNNVSVEFKSIQCSDNAKPAIDQHTSQICDSYFGNALRYFLVDLILGESEANDVKIW